MAHYILYKDFYIFALLSWKMTDENYVWERKMKKNIKCKKEKSMLQLNHIWSRSQNNLRLTIFCWERCIMVRIEITSSNFGPIHFTSFGIYAKLVISQLCIINKMKYDLRYPFSRFSTLISLYLKTRFFNVYVEYSKISWIIFCTSIFLSIE